MARRRPGEVRDAIHEFLQKNKDGSTVTEIQSAIDQKFGEEIPSSSVRSSLRLSDLFQQVERGRYKLKGN